MATTNAQKFSGALESVVMNERVHVAMFYWRDTPGTVKVSIADIDNLGDVMLEFKSKFEGQLALVPELSHIRVEIRSQEDIGAIRNKDISRTGGSVPKACMYLHGNAAMDKNDDVL